MIQILEGLINKKLKAILKMMMMMMKIRMMMKTKVIMRKNKYLNKRICQGG